MQHIRDFRLTSFVLFVSAVPCGAQTTELVRTHSSPGHRQFGRDVASAGDLDADGRPDYLVGAPDFGPFGLDGRVYAYRGSDGALLRTFAPPTAGREARFGASVANAGDVNGDGVSDVLVGEPDQDGATGELGRAYVFSGATGAVLRTIVPPASATAGQFGEHVASAGDVDGDGVADLLVGAPDANGPTVSFSGQAFVHSGATGALLRTLNTPTPRNGGNFGLSGVAIEDDDGDGVRDLAIGAPNEGATSFAGFGAVHVFSGANGAFVRTILSPQPSEIGRFGRALERAFDADGDGRVELLIGAPNEGSPGVGRAYLWDLATNAARATFVPPPNAGSQIVGAFGTALSAFADVTADGVPDVWIGDPEFRDALFVPPLDAGRAHLYDGASGARILDLRAPQEQDSAEFGAAIAYLGDVEDDADADVVIGQPGFSGGRAYVFASTAPLAFCAGDGTAAACPCGNAGGAGRGCASSIGVGALLASSGSARVSADTLVLRASSMPAASFVLYFQGDAQLAAGAGAPFGDGLRCAGGAVIRLATKPNSGGTSQYPESGDAPVSVRGAVSAGDVRHYQAWYRNAAAFCTAATFNLTNGLSVRWRP